MDTTEASPRESTAMDRPVVAPAPAPVAVAVAAEPAGLPGAWARIVAWDLALLRWLSARALPRWVTLPLLILARAGDGYVWVAVAASLAWFKPWADMKLLAAQCLVALAVSLAFYWPIKLLVRRPRPHESGLGVSARVPPLDRFSFPSGHTMNNLAVALTVSLHVPGTAFLALSLPLLFGVLRILFGVHYLSDITGGAALGLLSFWLGSLAFSALAS